MNGYFIAPKDGKLFIIKGEYTFKFACDDTAYVYMSLVPNSTL